MNKYHYDGENVAIYDDKKGMYVTNFQDNIDEILKNENNIEILEEMIKEKNLELLSYRKEFEVSYSTTFIWYVMFMYILIGLTGVFYVFWGFNAWIIPVVAAFLVFTRSSLSDFKKAYKQYKFSKNNLPNELAYLVQKLEEAEIKDNNLKKDTTASKNPRKRVISLINYNIARKKLLEKELDILCMYKENKDFYQEKYQDGTLNEELSDRQELKLMRNLIESENNSQKG